VRGDWVRNPNLPSDERTIDRWFDTTFVVPSAPGVMSNDIDADGDPLTAAVNTLPLFGTLTLNADGSFAYTPNAGYIGPDSFTYSVNDGLLTSAPTAVALTVVDTPPVAVADTYTGSHDTPLTIAAPGVLGNDIDLEGDPLTAIVDVNPLFGTLTLNPDGSFTYTPNAAFVGADTFTYHANDGALNSAPAVVTLSVVETPPVALPDSFTVGHDNPLVIAAPGVLGNDIDLEGDPLTAIVDVAPLNGTLTLNPDGSFTYTPNAGFLGADAFTYHANDGLLNSAPTVVALNVVNTPPIAGPDAYTVTEDIPLTVAAPGVLGNDIDLEGDPLTAVIDTLPLNGTLTLTRTAHSPIRRAPTLTEPMRLLIMQPMAL